MTYRTVTFAHSDFYGPAESHVENDTWPLALCGTDLAAIIATQRIPESDVVGNHSTCLKCDGQFWKGIFQQAAAAKDADLEAASLLSTAPPPPSNPDDIEAHFQQEEEGPQGPDVWTQERIIEGSF